MIPAKHIPVVVAVGESIDRADAEHRGLDPVALMAQAARAADADAGGGWLGRVTRLEIIHQFTWNYADAAGALCTALGINPRGASYGDVGGETPIKNLMRAAAAISGGSDEITLIVGAEAMHSLRALSGKDGSPPPGWAKPTAPSKGLDGSDYVTALAKHYNLTNPTEVYTLYEHATRAAWGQTAADAQEQVGDLWAEFAQVATGNPMAWRTAPMSAAEVLRIGPKNRPISHPYCKNLVAQIFVNQGAAFIVTSLARAREAGVDDGRLAFVWSGAGAVDLDDFLKRERYDDSAPQAAVLRSTLDLNGLVATDFDAVELYSCFPCVPRMALRVLGALKPDVAPTVTGGLSFFGGPGNNYMSHAVAAMVRKIRDGARLGLLYGQGGFVTKHHAAVLAAKPPLAPVRDSSLSPSQAAVQQHVTLANEDYEGAATLESYLLQYGKGGEPDRATIVARTLSGHRVVARLAAGDAAGLHALTAALGEPVGSPGRITREGEHAIWRFEPAISIPIGAPGSVVVLERRGHVAVVTLNRPVVRNAVNLSLTRALRAVVAEVEADAELRVAILRSCDPQVFCAGLDLSQAMGADIREIVAGEGGFAGFVNARRRKPWIVAVHGQALGGGCELALAADLIVAARDASFGLPEVKRGIIAAAGGAYRLPRAMPRALAIEAAITGEPISALVAHGHGMVNRLVDASDVDREALALAERIAANAPLAVQETLALSRCSADASDTDLSLASLEAGFKLLTSSDAREGTQAFLEKRPPRWRGA